MYVEYTYFRFVCTEIFSPTIRIPYCERENFQRKFDITMQAVFRCCTQVVGNECLFMSAVIFQMRIARGADRDKRRVKSDYIVIRTAEWYDYIAEGKRLGLYSEVGVDVSSNFRSNWHFNINVILMLTVSDECLFMRRICICILVYVARG